MLIEGAVTEWVVSQVQEGVDWNSIEVHPPDDAPQDAVQVLLVPIASGSVETVRERIKEALGAD